MGLWRWLRSGGSGPEARRAEWKRAWQAALDGGDPDEAARAALAEQLDALGLPEEETEIEREMIEALRLLAELAGSVRSAGLPVVETGHRVVARDRCHFSAPASMPDHPAQPSGRLLLTASRAVFVGGGNSTSVPWHGVGQVLQSDRDLILVARRPGAPHRFRCNSFGDALCSAFLSRRLAGGASTPP